MYIFFYIFISIWMDTLTNMDTIESMNTLTNMDTYNTIDSIIDSVPATYELQLYTIIDNKTYKDNQNEYDENVNIIICFISLSSKIILLNKRFINSGDINTIIPNVDEYIDILNPRLNPLCIIDYDCILKIKQTYTDLKYILLQCLKIIDIMCFISNIKIVDMCNYVKLNTINSLNVNNTKTCKIIITPIECCKHNNSF